MNRSTSARLALLCLAVAGVTGTLAAAIGSKLILNGKVASTDVRVINGKAYVPVADVAKALGMVVVKRSDGYEIKKPGGANPIKGVMQGKVGDVLFDGKWRFQVLKVEMPESYTIKSGSEPSSNLYASSEWNRDTRTLTPKPNFKLVVLQCRVTNGQNSKQTLWTAPSDDKLRTSITDMNGGSYPPMAYDYPGGPNQTQPLVPGAIITFPVVFGVPADARLKDLIFTLKNNDYFEKGNDVRVSLTDEQIKETQP
ncbi:MAG: copper amine oxidase N-terminal domain-containing protein [Armatimonadota bacterium]|nr:copper amine oxidase N-terminal domain-containing protein [Armatimonadota bacterium]